MKTTALLLHAAFAASIALHTPVAQACSSGLVFDDRDGDGVRDAGEPGLAGIPMSNGRDIVRTDT